MTMDTSAACAPNGAAETAKRTPPEAAPEPEAKRARLPAPDLAAVRKQVEHYLSDDNLKRDKFFHEKISSSADGWLEMNLILSCNKMKAMRASKEIVLDALKDSKVEIRGEGEALRRPGNCALPTLEAKPQHPKKNSMHAHDGGVVAVIAGVPAEQNWLQVKEKLKELMPPKSNLWFISEVTDKQLCFLAAAPFDGDTDFFARTSLELGGKALKTELAQGELLQQGLKLLPKHIRERREKESRKRQKEKNRAILIGTQRFLNVGALRGRVREILNSRSEGEHLKPEGSDFMLIKALLQHHPKGEEKSKGMVGLKVAKSTQGDNRCFFLVREDGAEEDFSAKKCLDSVEANPPYAPVAEKPKSAAALAAATPQATVEATTSQAIETPAAQEKAEVAGEKSVEAPATDAKQ